MSIKQRNYQWEYGNNFLSDTSLDQVEAKAKYTMDLNKNPVYEVNR